MCTVQQYTRAQVTDQQDIPGYESILYIGPKTISNRTANSNVM